MSYMNNLKQQAIELFKKLQSKSAVARQLNIPRETVRNWILQEEKSPTKIPREEMIEDIKSLSKELGKEVTRDLYRKHGNFGEAAWKAEFGNFNEFKSAAGLSLNRAQKSHLSKIAKHAEHDLYKDINAERKSYGEKYLKPTNNKVKQVIVVNDLHDKNIDQFFLEVFLDTLKRTEPDVIVLNGDIFDLPEFSKYHVDPRTWDVVGRIKYVHEHILKPIREICPDTQIDFIEGNHEWRLLKHLADATPALQAVLSDLHGMTVSSLLGLDKFNINYIAKGNLSAYSLSETHREISKNYKIYWDSFIISHEGHAKTLGFPGINGHHHKTVIESLYNEHFGAYNWIQLGCGHVLDAEYCHPKWQQGFAIITCDTEKRETVFDTITFSENYAVVGGKVYTRNK